MDVIEHPPLFRLPAIACQWSPFECHRAGFVPDHVTFTWVMIGLLAVLAFVASRDVRLVPRGLQNFFEVVLEQFQQLIDDVIGPEGRPYLPLIATLGLFVLTGGYLKRRGHCCGKGCRHCPYPPDVQRAAGRPGS